MYGVAPTINGDIVSQSTHPRIYTAGNTPKRKFVSEKHMALVMCIGGSPLVSSRRVSSYPEQRGLFLSGIEGSLLRLVELFNEALAPRVPLGKNE
jgi:hypothetical protein